MTAWKALCMQDKLKEPMKKSFTDDQEIIILTSQYGFTVIHSLI